MKKLELISIYNKNSKLQNNILQVHSTEERMDLGIKSVSHQLAKSLRKNSTHSEKIFWEIIRNRKLEGKKFYRQYHIKFKLDDQDKFFIADFYCHEAKIVIELDGSIHELQKEYDELRDFIILNLGIKVIRFKNEEITNNLELVTDKIKAHFL